jgi:hypothetical protein
VDREDHSISVRERNYVHILGGEGYGNVGTLGLSDGAFDGYMVYFPVVISTVLLGVIIGVGTFGDCEDCAMGGDDIILFLGFLDLWWRVGFSFNLRVGVVWHWVGDLWSYWRICYLWSWRRVRYLGSW